MQQRNLKQHQHYVPKFYLTGFAPGDRLWAFNLERGNSFPSQPKSVANGKNLWPHDVEAFLNSDIEYPAAAALARARDMQPLTDEDKRRLAEYMLSVSKRGPHGRRVVREHMPRLAAKQLRAYRAELSTARPGTELHAVLEEVVRRTADPEYHGAQQAEKVWGDVLGLKSTALLIDVVAAMRWRSVMASGSSFLTCDTPFCFDKGLGRPDGEFLFPVSSKVALVGSHGIGEEWAAVQWDHRRTRDANAWIVDNADRFVYGESGEDKMERFIFRRRAARKPTG